jgi:hypothetical protein
MMVNRLIGAIGYTPTVASLYNTPNPAGSAGNPVIVTISNLVDSLGNGMLPHTGSYGVVVSASQACFASVSNKTASGFEVTLTPISGGSIGAGVFDCWVST